MIGPVSSTGRAMMASLQQAMSKGMPVDQAVAYVKSMAAQGVAPLTDLYAMLNQVQRLKQPPAQMPQTPPTIKDQINMAAQQRAMQDQAMVQGLGGMNAGVMENPQSFNAGGIVAFAEGSDDVISSGARLPDYTPQQIDLLRERQMIAEQLMRGPVSITDPNYKPPDFIVDSKGRLVPKERVGELIKDIQAEARRAARGDKSALKPTPSPWRSDVDEWKRSQSLGSTSEAPKAPQDAPKRGWAQPGERPSGGIRQLLSRAVPEGALGKAGAAAGLGILGYDAARLAGISNEELRQYYGKEGEGGGFENMLLRGRAFLEAQRPESISMPGLAPAFNVNTGWEDPIAAIRERRKSAAATPAAQAASQASATAQGQTGPVSTGRPPAAATEKDPAQSVAAAYARPAGMLGSMIADEKSRYNEIIKGLNDGTREAQEYDRLVAQAQADKTGPYSEMFGRADEMMQRRMAELDERKKNSFGRALVNAGLAMAAQAAKGGQPGGETQKFLAAAIAGIGGYSEAQQFMKKEIDQSQREYDDMMLRIESAREQGRGELRGAARQRISDLERRADSARTNLQRLSLAQAQLEANREIAGMRAQASAAGAANRAQASQDRFSFTIRKQAEKNLETSGPGIALRTARMSPNPPPNMAQLEQAYEALVQREIARLSNDPNFVRGTQAELAMTTAAPSAEDPYGVNDLISQYTSPAE